MAIWTLAKKDLRLLVRDPRALIILIAMPLIFILILGMSLGEGFGERPDNRLRVSLVVEDQGSPVEKDKRCARVASFAAGSGLPWAALTLVAASNPMPNPEEKWSEVVKRDLAETSGIRLEVIDTRAEALELLRNRKRAAVVVLGPTFTQQVSRSSFLAGDADPTGINPFEREGIVLEMLDVEVLKDPTQQTASAIIEQVTQGTLLRVVLPWMIGRAFEKLGDETFIDRLGERMTIPFGLTDVKLKSVIKTDAQKRAVGIGVQNAIKDQFGKYDLTAKTWAALTRAKKAGKEGVEHSRYSVASSGLLNRGALRYRLLVPSYTVMFAFFLVLTIGWSFVAERRQGTAKRLRAAPIAHWQILLGKMLPCLLMSLGQGFFLIGAGRLIFGLNWDPEPLWLVPVIASTSLSATGLGMLVAALAKTETQVAIYGSLLVLVLAGMSGTLMGGDPYLIPESMEMIRHLTPHAWALDAYQQILVDKPALGWRPDGQLIGQACLVLTGFGVGFLALAWGVLRME